MIKWNDEEIIKELNCKICIDCSKNIGDFVKCYKSQTVYKMREKQINQNIFDYYEPNF